MFKKIFIKALYFTLIGSFCFTGISYAKNTGEIIAIPKQRMTLSQVEKKLLTRGIAYQRKIELGGLNKEVVIFNVSPSENISESVQDLKESNLFEYVEPNYILYSDAIKEKKLSLELMPNDKEFGNQYYLNLTQVTKSWLYSTGALNMPIAILDSGVDFSNLDLQRRVSSCLNALTNSFTCEDNYGHGTKIASIIGAEADNTLGTAGVTWTNPIVAIKVSDENGIASVSSVIDGFKQAQNSQAKIIVISLSTNQKSEILGEVIKDIYSGNILIFASGGNTGLEEVRYPAGYEEVIGVGSVSREQVRSDFSTRGKHIQLVAPGENVLVPKLRHDALVPASGTSFSTPQVAGVAALIWAVKPELTNEEVKKLLFKTAKDLGEEGYDIEYGYGLVNAYKAIKEARK